MRVGSACVLACIMSSKPITEKECIKQSIADYEQKLKLMEKIEEEQKILNACNKRIREAENKLADLIATMKEPMEERLKAKRKKRRKQEAIDKKSNEAFHKAIRDGTFVHPDNYLD